MDGSTCVIAFVRAGGKMENVRFVAAGMVERFLKDESRTILNDPRFCIFADVGVNEAKYGDMLEKRGSCVLLDHHRTSEHLADRPWCYIDAVNCGTACGSTLLANYLVAHELMSYNVWQELQSLLKMVDQHDRWLPTRTEAAEDLATLSAFLGQERFIEMFRDFGVGSNLDGRFFNHFQLTLLDILKERRDEHIETSMKRVIVKPIVAGGTEYKAAWSFSQSQDTSLLMSRILEARPDVQVACHVNLHKKTVSLRSRSGEVDCSAVARAFGGGGHAGAAGFALPDGLLTSIVETING